MFGSFLLLFSCVKKEENITNDTNVIVDDNTAPPFNEVTTISIQNYINKLYIDLIGREPLAQELEETTMLLKENELSDNVKQTVIDDLQNTDE